MTERTLNLLLILLARAVKAELVEFWDVEGYVHEARLIRRYNGKIVITDGFS